MFPVLWWFLLWLGIIGFVLAGACFGYIAVRCLCCFAARGDFNRANVAAMALGFVLGVACLANAGKGPGLVLVLLAGAYGWCCFAAGTRHEGTT